MLEQIWLASQRYVRLFVAETVDDAMGDHRELLVVLRERDAAAPRSSFGGISTCTELAVRQAFPARSTGPTAG